MLGQGSIARCEQYVAIGLELERGVAGLAMDAAVTLTVGALRKAESDVTDDPGMIEDMKIRTRRIAATA
jgi:hypothetical protein